MEILDGCSVNEAGETDSQHVQQMRQKSWFSGCSVFECWLDWFSGRSADESRETGAQVVQLMGSGKTGPQAVQLMRVKRRVLRLFTVQLMSVYRLVLFWR